MSKVIRTNAEITRIEDHVRRALLVAKARGGEIAAAGQARLGPAVDDIDAALAARHPAIAAETAAWVAVTTEADKSHHRICTVRDDLWGALGRPRRSRYLDHVFPEGVGTYTSGDPRQQPILMKMLQARITSCAAPQLTDEQRQAWIAEIEAARKPFEDAVESHRPTEAPKMLAEASYRSAVRAGHDQLRSFERDLENQGLSRAQIFDIIPDGARATASAKAGKGPKGSGTGETGGTSGTSGGGLATPATPAPANANANASMSMNTNPKAA